MAQKTVNYCRNPELILRKDYREYARNTYISYKWPGAICALPVSIFINWCAFHVTPGCGTQMKTQLLTLMTGTEQVWMHVLVPHRSGRTEKWVTGVKGGLLSGSDSLSKKGREGLRPCITSHIKHYMCLLLLPWRKTTDCMVWAQKYIFWNLVVYFRTKMSKGWFLLRFFSLACRWSLPSCVLICPSSRVPTPIFPAVSRGPPVRLDQNSLTSPYSHYLITWLYITRSDLQIQSCS